MLRLFVASLLVSASLLPAGASAAGLKIAVVAPSDGPFALLGRQMLAGAQFQAGDRGTEIVAIRETCNPADADRLTKDLVAAGAEAAIGFLCTESLEAVLPALAESGIPALTLSVRSDILMEDARKKDWPLFRLGPDTRAEAGKIADVILMRWKDEPLALIDDGTIHGRELIDGVKTRLAEVGLTPVFTDTFRPAQEQQLSLVRRLARSGATHVLIGGDRSDIATIARDAKGQKFLLTLMGGDAMRAADAPVPLADGTLAVAVPEATSLPEARDISAAMAAANIVPEGYVLPAFAAVTLLEQAKDIAAKDGIALAEALKKEPFSTVIGSVGFTPQHELADNPYRLLRWQDGAFRPAD